MRWSHSGGARRCARGGGRRRGKERGSFRGGGDGVGTAAFVWGGAASWRRRWGRGTVWWWRWEGVAGLGPPVEGPVGEGSGHGSEGRGVRWMGKRGWGGHGSAAAARETRLHLGLLKGGIGVARSPGGVRRWLSHEGAHDRIGEAARWEVVWRMGEKSSVGGGLVWRHGIEWRGVPGVGAARDLGCAWGSDDGLGSRRRPT